MAHEDEVNTYAETPEPAPKPNELGVAILDLWLDDEKVQVAARASLATRTRPKDNDRGRLGRRCG